MENAKDSFYLAMRQQLAAINPARVAIIRGLTRPGILVEEAEPAAAQLPGDMFVLRWGAVMVDIELPNPLVQMQCEIHYATSGTQGNAGLDRGRCLAAMDAELIAMMEGGSAAKSDYTLNPAVLLRTRVWWTMPAFGPQTTLRDRLSRVAKTTVFSYQEEGER